MTKLLRIAALALPLAAVGALAAGGIDPPWNPPPENGKNFTVPGINNVPDLYGDVTDPQLVVLFAGNQYMVVPDLLAASDEPIPGTSASSWRRFRPGSWRSNWSKVR